MKEIDNIQSKLLKMRKGFLESNIKKSAENTYAKYSYYTLEDILPVLQMVQEENKALVTTSFEYDDANNQIAITRVINIEDATDVIEFKSCVDIFLPVMKIKGTQAIGANHTYFRRYMLLIVFEINEADVIEMTTGMPENKKANITPNKQAVNNDDLTKIKEEFKNNAQSYANFKEKNIKDIFNDLKINGTSSKKEIESANKMLVDEINKRIKE